MEAVPAIDGTSAWLRQRHIVSAADADANVMQKQRRWSCVHAWVVADGGAKCCQVDALARQMATPASMQSGAGCGGCYIACHQWRDLLARDEQAQTARAPTCSTRRGRHFGGIDVHGHGHGHGRTFGNIRVQQSPACSSAAPQLGPMRHPCEQANSHWPIRPPLALHANPTPFCAMSLALDA